MFSSLSLVSLSSLTRLSLWLYTALSEGWNCVRRHDNLKEFSVPLSLSLGGDLCLPITKATHTIDAHVDYLYGLPN